MLNKAHYLLRPCAGKFPECPHTHAFTPCQCSMFLLNRSTHKQPWPTPDPVGEFFNLMHSGTLAAHGGRQRKFVSRHNREPCCWQSVLRHFDMALMGSRPRPREKKLDQNWCYEQRRSAYGSLMAAHQSPRTLLVHTCIPHTGHAHAGWKAVPMN